MTTNKQQRLKKLVNREVIMWATGLVTDLLEQATLLEGNTFGNIDINSIKNYYITKNGEFIKRVKVDEWWFVTEWLYERLKEAKQPVLDSHYGYLWGRTCTDTDQPIYMDTIIQTIFSDLVIEQQKRGRM